MEEKNVESSEEKNNLAYIVANDITSQIKITKSTGKSVVVHGLTVEGDFDCISYYDSLGDESAAPALTILFETDTISSFFSFSINNLLSGLFSIFFISKD